MYNFFIIFTFLSLGMLFQKLPINHQKISNVLNKCVINIIIPAVIILNTPDLISDHTLHPLIYMPWLIIACSCIIILLLARLFQWDKTTTGAILLMGTLGNTSFVGFPMVQAFLGDEALQYALVYDQIGNFLALAIFGSAVIAIFGPEEKTNKGAVILSIVKRIMTFPPFIALSTMLILKSISINVQDIQEISHLLKPISLLLTPTTMFIIGINFTFQIDPKHISAFSAGLSIKLIAAPTLMYIATRNLDSPQLLINSLVFESAMPPMVTAAALAMNANLQSKLCASMVGIGLLISFVTLPLLSLLMKVI